MMPDFFPGCQDPLRRHLFQRIMAGQFDAFVELDPDL